MAKLSAWLRGQDPTKVKGGVLVQNRWFGQWGTVGNSIAKKWQDAKPEQREKQDEFWNIVFGGMDKECYNAGECKICGCQTTHLQMADKACDKPCYPEMLSRKNWKSLKEGLFYPDGKRWWKLKYNKFIIDNE